MEAFITTVDRVNPHDLVIQRDGISWRGSGTVWHRVKDGKRANAPLESILCDMFTKHTWWEDDQRGDSPWPSSKEDLTKELALSAIDELTQRAKKTSNSIMLYGFIFIIILIIFNAFQ